MGRVTGTMRQQQALTFIKAYRDAHGVTPLYVEIRDHLGLNSTSGVHRIMRGMEERGLITRVPGATRGVQIVATAKDAIMTVLDEVELTPGARLELMGRLAEMG